MAKELYQKRAVMASKITNRWKTSKNKGAFLENVGNVKEIPEGREAFVHPHRTKKILSVHLMVTISLCIGEE